MANAQHSRALSLESELGAESSRSPTLPADYEDTEYGKATQESIPQASASLPDRFQQLTAAVWGLDRDEDMESVKRRKISTILEQMEQLIKDDGSSPIDIDSATNEEDDYIDEQDLYQVHDALISTVHEMRLRTQEHKHLHLLTAVQLDTIAQQTDQIDTLNAARDTLHLQNSDLGAQCDSLRHENNVLGTENDTLRLRGEEMKAHIKALQAEVERQSVALTAMTSAVTGLEEWMDYHKSTTANDSRTAYNGTTGPYRNNGFAPRTQPGSKPRTIVRGIGRFRGRYQVDVDDDGDNEDEYTNEHAGSVFSSRNRLQPYVTHRDESYGRTSTPKEYLASDTAFANGYPSDLQDDVRAWIRGCRDVLECAQAGAESLPKRLESEVGFDHLPAAAAESRHDAMGHVNGDNDGDGDEWGEFESA